MDYASSPAPSDLLVHPAPGSSSLIPRVLTIPPSRFWEDPGNEVAFTQCLLAMLNSVAGRWFVWNWRESRSFSLFWIFSLSRPLFFPCLFTCETLIKLVHCYGCLIKYSKVFNPRRSSRIQGKILNDKVLVLRFSLKSLLPQSFFSLIKVQT